MSPISKGLNNVEENFASVKYKLSYKLLCVFCVIAFCLSSLVIPVSADEISGKTASVFAYTLNNSIYNYGVVSTAECGGYVEVECCGGIYPSGIIYADIINFDNNETPYLVIFRSDNGRGCVSADIYKFNAQTKTAELVTVLSKGYNLSEGVVGEFCLGFNAEKRFIVYNEYADAVKTKTEYYTVMDGTAFQYVVTPDYAEEAAVLSFSSHYLHPETDVSCYNQYLDVFFSKLKNASADSVTHTDISDYITDVEEKRIENVLTTAARIGYLDINNYETMTEYEEALESGSSPTLFYLITHLYDLGDEIYYVRFSGDCSFYNYAILRRTGKIDSGYQILAVRTDSIPLSDVELAAAKESYMRSKLVMKKASGTIDKIPFEDTGLINIEKPIYVPKLISNEVKKPIALIGGGICAILFAALWIYMARNDE